eukprot:TRINITY_DN16843_c0_g2_i1.p1 TRINITY_DN16843_c0_g2~~TRINITY_DN16843_c0_g2_i1.p1  ORF type:complete len:329 (-),score=33.97 TRINITY_DN16843_c0_g2_i1:75-1004(-)
MARFQKTRWNLDQTDIDVCIDDLTNSLTSRGHSFQRDASSSAPVQSLLASGGPWADHMSPHYVYQRGSAHSTDIERIYAEVCDESVDSDSVEPEPEDDCQNEPILECAPLSADAGSTTKLESSSGSHMCLNHQDLGPAPGLSTVTQPIGAASELFSHARNVPMCIPKIPPGVLWLATEQASSRPDNVLRQVQEVQQEQLQQQQQQQHQYTARLQPGRLSTLPCSTFVPLPLPTQPSGLAQGIPSVGSFGHPMFCAGPCKFFRKTRGCKDSDACNRCHLCSWRRLTTSQAKQLRKSGRTTHSRSMHPSKS